MNERNLIGYGPQPPDPRWPGNARIAIQFVLNIEEGAESSVLNGDAYSEAYLHELLGRPVREKRDFSVESMYEYGSRTGVWRILQLFNDRGLPLTAFAVGQALERNPEIGAALVAGKHEIAGHGYRWLDYSNIPENIERRHIQLTLEIIERICGKRPVGWYTGRCSTHTHRLLSEIDGILYSSDAYNDDLPYWVNGSSPSLIIPYTLVNNDARYLLPNGFRCGDEFYQSLKDAFDLLWQEGEQYPKMMSIGLHGRISGHPARAMALMRFLDYIQDYDSVWICRREEIAGHWIAKHPPVIRT